MPHSEETRMFCKSLTQLSRIADQFVKQDGENLDMETLLQECIDTLVNYQDECKKVRKLGPGPDTRDPAVFEAYESAYVYYKIVSQIVLNKIPDLPQFVQAKDSAKSQKERGLLEVYNMLLKTLLTDEKIGELRKFLKDHSRPEPRQHKKGAGDVSKTWANGQAISPSELQSLLGAQNALLIDLRPRIKFVESHIKTDKIMCIEPISFKDSYSDTEITRRSLITSPNEEVQLFQERDKFDYIVIYTDEHDRTQFCKQKQASLVDLLVNRSFEKPLQRTIILTLQGGFENWCRNRGPCDKSESSEETNFASEYGVPPLIPKILPALRPIPPSAQDPLSVKGGMTLNTSLTHDKPLNTQPFPEQQQPRLKRTSSFKDKFSSLTPSRSRAGSPSLQSPTILHTDSTTYPDAPQLAPSSVQLNALSQLQPIHSRAVTPQSKSLSPPRYNVNGSGQLTSDLMGHSPSPPKPVIFPVSSQSSVANYQNGSKPLTRRNTNFTVGLTNLGNSCYMNCIIQCLLGTHELTQIFLDDSYKNHVNLNSKLGSKGVLAKYFSQLIHTMQQQAASASTKQNSGDKTAVQPLHFKVACGSINSLFRSSSQQDCQEFCQFLLDGLHEDLNQCGGNPALKELSEEAEGIREKLCMRIASSIEWERYLTTDFSVIVDLFQGQYASQLTCKVCGRTSTTYQPFSVLSVPVPSGSKCDIIDCFKEFTKVETLEKDEQWSCPRCKCKQPSTKKITITRLPRNLVIHLKRFDNLLHKNNIFVSYPHTLDLTPFWANDFDGRLPPGVAELPTRGQVPPFNYNLYAVACHFGTLYGGHYTSYVDKGDKAGWCYFDDTSWRKAKSQGECITLSAYVLFYHRKYNVS
ncbi:ubiquitin-specific protease DOA4 [Lachancea thermotolerans CBS 6340]|uniref:Ubiquitin carboxyl-terminal hydrolase n=1 Tax=Lachancea thermotolerans (strain ATCC 56472 / CBS 6340 / NRRL Y-8284) TaxID=559295 RepID=C5E2U0_LACTC|nr:KLTH0H07678p [Lachancea thermotolerans CBS 6340]CAR30351.1 KLTH0H07678p [Lachancea thermotolerans CBS 6340]